MHGQCKNVQYRKVPLSSSPLHPNVPSSIACLCVHFFSCQCHNCHDHPAALLLHAGPWRCWPGACHKTQPERCLRYLKSLQLST